MSNVIQFPTFRLPSRDAKHSEYWHRLDRLFASYSVDDMRRFWDGCGDDSFYHGPEGDFDCADIHSYMNMIGDGAYCAV